MRTARGLWRVPSAIGDLMNTVSAPNVALRASVVAPSPRLRASCDHVDNSHGDRGRRLKIRVSVVRFRPNQTQTRMEYGFHADFVFFERHRHLRVKPSIVCESGGKSK